jgi:hypothetical protein
MHFRKIKSNIWNGNLTESTSFEATAIARLLKMVLPMNIVGVVKTDGDESAVPAVFMGSQELEPGLTLSEMLYEEMDLYVEDDTLVLIMPEHAFKLECSADTSYWAGYIVGEVMGAFVRKGLFPIQSVLGLVCNGRSIL